MVNHFGKNNVITTKVGLTQSLKNLIWWNNVDVKTFYPNCFDLTEMEELDDFMTDFKCIKVILFLTITAVLGGIDYQEVRGVRREDKAH